MRAKLVITTVTQHEHQAETLKFRGVCANSYPADGLDENNTFAKFSPSVSLEMTVTNPALIGKYKPGQTFYVDFTETV